LVFSSPFFVCPQDGSHYTALLYYCILSFPRPDPNPFPATPTPTQSLVCFFPECRRQTQFYFFREVFPLPPFFACLRGSSLMNFSLPFLTTAQLRFVWPLSEDPPVYFFGPQPHPQAPFFRFIFPALLYAPINFPPPDFEKMESRLLCLDTNTKLLCPSRSPRCPNSFSFFVPRPPRGKLC